MPSKILFGCNLHLLETIRLAFATSASCTIISVAQRGTPSGPLWVESHHVVSSTLLDISDG